MLFEGHGQSPNRGLSPVSPPIPTVMWGETLECMSQEKQALLQQWRTDLHNTPLKALWWLVYFVACSSDWEWSLKYISLWSLGHETNPWDQAVTQLSPYQVWWSCTSRRTGSWRQGARYHWYHWQVCEPWHLTMPYNAIVMPYKSSKGIQSDMI